MDFDIKRVAELARLNLKPDEQEKLAGDLEKILDYVKNLDTLDTEGVEPTSHVLNLENVYRKDETKKFDVRDKALKHAPQTEGTFFKVPKVVEQE